MAFEDGPYLTAAVICKEARQASDHTWSLLGLYDQYPVQGGTDDPEVMPPTKVTTTLFLQFRSGSARGRWTVTVRPEKPSGLRMRGGDLPILFRGEEMGEPIRLNLENVFDEEGLYWFDILLNGTLITRVPLRVTYLRVGRAAV